MRYYIWAVFVLVTILIISGMISKQSEPVSSNRVSTMSPAEIRGSYKSEVGIRGCETSGTRHVNPATMTDSSSKTYAKTLGGDSNKCSMNSNESCDTVPSYRKEQFSAYPSKQRGDPIEKKNEILPEYDISTSTTARADNIDVY